MPELFLELFSEEIPARMQARAAEDLEPAVHGGAGRHWRPPACAHARSAPAASHSRRTWRRRSPPAAPPSAARAPTRPSRRWPASCASTARRREQLRQEGDYWVLEKAAAAMPAAALIADAIPPLLRRFPWPKSMRWGGTQQLHLGPPAAPHRLPAGRRGGAVRPARRRGRRAWAGIGRPDRGPPLPCPRRFRGDLLRGLGGQLRDRRVLVDAAERKRDHRRRDRRARRRSADRWWTIPGCWTKSPDWWNGRCRCSAASTRPTWTCRPRCGRSRCG